MNFVKVASVKELMLGKMVSVEVDGKKVLVVNVEGKYYSIGNICTHMGCLLSNGVLNGDNIQCRCHGSVFDLKTGNVVKGPAKKSEPALQVKVEGDEIIVSF